MDEVSKTGRTILFVSHQMGTIAQLCQRTILLQNGVVVMNDKTNLVIDYYLNQRKSKSSSYSADVSAKHNEIYVKSAAILNGEENEQSSFRHDEPITVRVKCAAQRMSRGVELRMAIRDGRSILGFVADVELNSLNENSREFQVDFTIPPNVMRPNNYSLIFSLFVPHQHIIELIEDVVFFSIFDGGTKYALSEGIDYGVMFSPCKVSIKQIG